MSQLPIGTTQQAFGSTYIYVDPQYINGLGMWRIYPGIPEAADVTGLGAILPIVSTDLGPESVKVSFNIAGLPSEGISQLSAFQLLQNPYASLPGMAPAGQTINTILPVNHVRAADKAVLYFDIQALERAEVKGRGLGFVDTSREKYKVTLKGYNKNNGVNIDSEAPMVDEVIGSTATFSFDITTLPKV